MKDIQIKNCIVCDDIRKEISNKDMLIGVYSGDIVLNALPTQLRLALWLELMTKKAGEIAFSIKIEGPDGKELFSFVDLKAMVKAASTFVLGMSNMDIMLRDQGDITISLKVDDGKWNVIKKKKVIYNAG